MRQTEKNTPAKTAEASGEGGVAGTLPPRVRKHPPEFLKLTRFFHVSLMILFVALIAGILTWYVFYYGEAY